jgi:hypothetical protein
VLLNIDAHFFKPVFIDSKLIGRLENHVETIYSSRKTGFLNDIMTCYERLRRAASTESKAWILFPVGVVTLPRSGVAENKFLREKLIARLSESFSTWDCSRLTLCPLVVYPMLRKEDGWSSDKPSHEHRDMYVHSLRLAVDLLNEAEIAHLDLRPENILWRVVRSGATPVIELKVIDFETAQPFGSKIPTVLIENVLEKRDYRYPFKLGDDDPRRVIRADRSHNEFFMRAISMWVHSDSESGFGSFMFSAMLNLAAEF